MIALKGSSSRAYNASIYFAVIISIFANGSLSHGQAVSEKQLHARAQLFTDGAPVSFPERVVVTASGKAFLLDSDLSTLFTLDHRSGRLTRMCGSESLSSPSDLTVDGSGNVWVLSAASSKIVKLAANCQTQAQIKSRQMPLRIAANAVGELIVLNGAGPNLFELYGSDGKLLRSFGERLDYKDETANSELSDGRIAPDSSGGFFFSFNYPPLIRHYGRNGKLVTEFKLESDIAIAAPNVSVRK